MRDRLFLFLVALSVLACGATAALAQNVAGRVFEDTNANGIQDAGEAAIEGVNVRLYGQRDAGGTLDETQATSVAGDFSFIAGNGCYLLDVDTPAGWRRSRTAAPLLRVPTGPVSPASNNPIRCFAALPCRSEIERQAEMPQVLGVVACLGHRAKRGFLHHRALRSTGNRA